jgi:hypothetical protein
MPQWAGVEAVSDLVEFLRARLDEDERDAIDWHLDAGIAQGWESLKDRVLAEVNAKRQIIDLHPIYRGPRIQGVDSRWCDFGCELCHSTSRIDNDSIIEAIGYCETLLALAQPYADHPDFDQEWKI